jgi:hypothetical protein
MVNLSIGGFQLLHAAYAVEYFLNGLVQRKCNFHIVFFEKHEELCIPRGTSASNSNKYTLARAAIIRHLSVHLRKSRPSIELHVFQSLNDPRFLRYLNVSGIYFVMCHDGANPVPASEDPSTLVKSEAERNRIESRETSRKVAFRGMICWLINQGYNAALINGLEWADTKVMTMVVEGLRRSRLTLNVLRDTAPPQSSQDLLFPDDLESRLSRLEISNRSEGGRGGNNFTERILLTIFTLAQILREDSTFQELALAFLIHTVLIEEVPISKRRQNWTSMKGTSDVQVVKFLSAFAAASGRIMQDDSWRGALESRNMLCDIVDLVDGRLFCGVVHQMAEGYNESNLSPEIISKLGILTQALYSSSGIRLRSDINGSTPDHTVTALENLDLQDKSRNTSVLPFSNRVFDKHLASISISVNNSRLPEGQSARIFREVSHWHNAKRRLDAKIALPVSDREKSRALRRNQFFMAEMQAYAASLTNAAGTLSIYSGETSKSTD